MRSDSERDTYRIGERLGKRFRGGEIVLLHGSLGMGKTVLARGLSAGCGVDPGEVRSPSFTLVNPYNGRLPVHHIDLYRIETDADLDELGLEEIFSGPGVSLVEWPERLGSYRPSGVIEIFIKDLGGDSRELRIKIPK